MSIALSIKSSALGDTLAAIPTLKKTFPSTWACSYGVQPPPLSF